MASRLVARSEAAYRARRQVLEAGRELRIARVAGGRRLADVARKAGLSVPYLSQLERGLAPAIRVADLARIGAAVGLRLSLHFYPLERRPLDVGQLRILGLLRTRLAPAWRLELEVPVPIPGDLRAADARLTGPVSIVVEAWTRLADVQAQVRAAQLKRRDLGADRLLMLIAATATNRRALRLAGDVVRASFPIGTREALGALAAGRDPGGDAIVLL